MARNDVTLQQLGEDEIVRRLTANLPLSPRTLAGAGDDCAVLTTANPKVVQLFKTDCIIENVHFLPDAMPRKIGWKALCRCISDIAAMGGKPTEAVVTLAAAKDMAWKKLSGIYQGLRDAAKKFSVGLVGGETSSIPTGGPLFISVSLLGEVDKKHLIKRSGGKLGDAIYVTGELGGSLRGWHLDFIPRVREAQWLVQNFLPTAMMDLSDGVGMDLPRLAEASGVGFELFPTLLPCRKGCSTDQALSDGEDYELLFTISAKKVAKLEAAWKVAFPKLRLTQIGQLVDDEVDPLGGWDHFA
jgi:thiamine-monophosphate kinase